MNAIQAAERTWDFIPTPAWISISTFSFLVAVLAHLWAKELPGVKNINHLPQFIALSSFAGAFQSFFLEIGLVESLANALKNLADDISGVLSSAWNIGGTVIALVSLVWFGLRYMGFMGEDKGESFKDALLFGGIAMVAALFVPWISEAVEYWRYSVISGTSNVIITILDSVHNWRITS